MVKQSNQHLIHRHILDVTISPKRERSSIEEQLKTLLSRDAAPVVEQVFNKVSQDGDYIYIDKLEIDLGKLDPEALNRNLLTTLRQKLGEALNKLLDQESQTYQGSQTEILHNGKEITSGTSGKRQGTVIRYTYKQTLSNAFFHFLKTSMLPETMRTYAIEELEKEMIRLQLTDAKLVEELRKLNKQIPYTTQRLAYQFSSRFLENLLENYGSFYKVYIDSGIKLFHDLLLNEAAGSETLSDDVYTSFVEKLMVVFLEETEYNGTNRQNLIQSLLTRWYRNFLISQDKATKETIKRIIEKWQGQSSPNKDIFTGQLMDLLEKESKWPDQGTSEDKRGTTDKSDTIIRQPGDNQTKNSDPHANWPGENNEYQGQTDQSEKSDPSLIENIKNLFHDDQEKSGKEEYHYITNSGLVLLTPYLQMFFGELGLVRENQFINRQAQIRAAFLFHYLANNDKWPEEPELVFNKVMLGLPIEMPVPKNVELKDAELRECDKLLHAVIENWGALKNTTPQGLREGFLQRPGKLSKVDNGWKLNVEQDTIDILLDSLPWSYQIVSFPWMKQVIFVKWN